MVIHHQRTCSLSRRFSLIAASLTYLLLLLLLTDDSVMQPPCALPSGVPPPDPAGRHREHNGVKYMGLNAQLEILLGKRVRNATGHEAQPAAAILYLLSYSFSTCASASQ